MTKRYEWAKDQSRFGLKLMQRMGWSEGKGLGREENGRIDNIVAQRKLKSMGKLRSMGVGILETRNSWKAPAAVAAGLNDVLARLTPVGVPSNTATKPDSGKTSLDFAISSNSTAPSASANDSRLNGGRGFYERRRARKDVNTYSENDLREIFGNIVTSSVSLAKKEADSFLSASKSTVKDAAEKDAQTIVSVEMQLAMRDNKAVEEEKISTKRRKKSTLKIPKTINKKSKKRKKICLDTSTKPQKKA